MWDCGEPSPNRQKKKKRQKKIYRGIQLGEGDDDERVRGITEPSKPGTTTEAEKSRKGKNVINKSPRNAGDSERNGLMKTPANGIGEVMTPSAKAPPKEKRHTHT